MTLEIGQIIDAKYRVVRRIGEGGMGTVYEGENSRIGRRVAIKVLHAQVAAMPDFVERFEREARAAARIGSPHVCDVLDLGDLPNGDRYIVMEYLDGISFEDRLVERGKLTTAQLAPIAYELLEGLATMHDARVIHRDLKPANIFLAKVAGGRGEKVKILDFGVAKLQPFGGEVGTMTQTGTMMGTPLYMSPEQARGARDVDGRTDIYAASVMFYRALAGTLPYNADTLNELLFKIVLEDPKPLRELAPEVDEVFAEIVHKGLAREITQRFETARAYQEAIASWGRTQGRASLSFAVTVPSEPPPGPSSNAEPARSATAPASAAAASAGGGVVAVASAVTGASAGTPIAWSDSSSEKPANSSRQAAETVLTAIGGADAQRTPASALPAPSALSAPSAPSAASSASAAPQPRIVASHAKTELSSTGPAKASDDPSSEVAKATTSPGAPLADVARTPAPKPEARSPRNLVLGIVGAGALAVVAIVAFGRSGGDRPTPAGMTPTMSAAPTAELATPSATPSAAVAVGSAALVPATTPATPATTADLSADANVAATTARDAGVARKPDPLKVGATTTGSGSSRAAATSAAATTSPGATATAPTAPTAPPATTAKPAASARKFRTNID